MQNQRDSCVETNPLTYNFVFPPFFLQFAFASFIHSTSYCVCVHLHEKLNFSKLYRYKGLKKCGFISVCTLASEFIVQFSELSQAVFSDSLSRQEVALNNIDSGGGEHVLRSCLCYVVILTVRTLKLSSASQLQNAD